MTINDVQQMPKNKRKFGDIGEDIACEHLASIGFEIIDRNYFYGHGEIDIIARDGDQLVFVEVKTRKSLEYGQPEDAITKGKIRQIRKIAEAYLYEHNIKDQICRFDFVGVLMQHESVPSGKDKEPLINHIRNAF